MAEDSIQNARAALEGAPSQETWERVLAIVDACPDDDLAALIDTIEPEVTRWEVPYSTRWAVDQNTYGCAGASYKWSQFMPLGELRVAPYSWTMDLAAGGDSPKYRLVHAVVTRDTGFNGSKISKILSCKSLTNLRQLDADTNKLSKTLFKKLRTAPSTRTLERFRFAHVDAKTVAGIEGEHHLENLRTLAMYLDFATREDALHALMRADAFAHVEDFEIYPGSAYIILNGLTGPDVLPNLKSLTFVDGGGRDLGKTLAHPVVARLERVRLDVWWQSLTRVLDDITAHVTTLRHLDLSLQGLEYGQAIAQPQHASELAEALRAWTPPSCLETLTLGRWHTDALADELSEAHGIAVVA